MAVGDHRLNIDVLNDMLCWIAEGSDQVASNEETSALNTVTIAAPGSGNSIVLGDVIVALDIAPVAPLTYTVDVTLNSVVETITVGMNTNAGRVGTPIKADPNTSVTVTVPALTGVVSTITALYRIVPF